MFGQYGFTHFNFHRIRFLGFKRQKMLNDKKLSSILRQSNPIF